MAKKKEAFASPFVPEEEQPYPIPENWCWTYLSCIAQWGSGGTPSRKNLAYYDGEIPWIKTGELNDDLIYEAEEHISDEAITNSSAKLFPIHTIIIAMYGATIGKVGILEIEAATNQACACAVSSVAIDYKYLFYYAKSQKNAFIKKGKGGAQPNISQEIIKTHEIPLPPLPEQHRIVSRIESLFAKLDEAKEKAQAVVDGFELRKSAILHKAFTGELTERWRKEHGVELDSWETVELSRRFDIVGGVQKKPSRSPKNNPIPYLTVANVFRDRIDLSEIRYFEVFDGELDKLKLQEKDILVVEGNGSGNEIGRCAMWRCELSVCIHQNHIIRLRATDSDTIPEYVLYFLNSSTGKRIMKERAKTTAGLFNLSTGKIRTIPVPFATVPEQVEIVHILDRLLDKEQQSKEASEAVLAQIDTMKKAILARAFRGELGTNDPAEEWAGQMLRTYLPK